MEEERLPGFRFYPTEEELVSFYLLNKLDGCSDDLNRAIHRTIPVLDIYDFNPSQLPQYSGELCPQDPEQWFFFIPLQESEARGRRPRRLTMNGFWKATGTPGYVYSSDDRKIAMKRTLVFYTGRAPRGRKTEWKMNEYKAIHADSNPTLLRHEFSLCRLYKRSKCVRAFDRRPMGAEIREVKGRGEIIQASEENAATTSQHKAAIKEEKRTSSQESSSSGDNNNNNNNDGESSKIGNEPPVWDWDQADWFFH